MEQLQREPDPVISPQVQVETVRPPETALDPQARALDAARAEFRARWQARGERLRRVAGICSRVDRWAGRLVLLLCLVVLCVAVARKVPNLLIDKHLMDLLSDGVLGLVSVQFLVLVAEAVCRRRADRLDADGVPHP